MRILQAKIEETRWSHHLEKEVLKKWEKLHKFSLSSKKKTFVIDTPPPYPSGKPWHIGAVAHYAQIDMIARTARMLGHEVLFPIGIDRNGLPVEIYAEKKYRINIHTTPREKFLEYCRFALDDLEKYMIKIMKEVGLSGEFGSYYRTDNEDYRKLTQATFIEMWKKNLIYEDTRPNNYCPVCRTTIADAEIIYQDIASQLVYIKFKLKDGDSVMIATTRPELITACRIIIVHPDDERYKDLHGKTVLTPIYNEEIRIVAHPSAKKEFGTGAAMICSYGDFSDVRIFRELKLKEVIAISEEGKMTHNAGPYAGLNVLEARRKIVEDLQHQGLVAKKEEVVHRTPTCERSKNPIEIIPMKEFYLKQLEFISKIRVFAETMKFHPEEHRKLLLDWIDSVSIDWPISRRRFYATEIPIWYCKNCGKPHVPKPGKYYQPWKDKVPFAKCSGCGAKEFVGETRTFDTWMDSSISPLFISKYMRDNKFFKKNFPNTIRPQSKDIIRTWMYYTLLRCYLLTGDMAWKHGWIMGYGVDEKGEKMSKSKGNVVDPLPVLERFGSDAFRYWSASEVNLGYDFRFSEGKLDGASKFLTKLWNVSRFISMFPKPSNARLTETDRWILGELGRAIEEAMKGYRDFNFFIPANSLREFLWKIFADHYVEMVKARAYGEGFTDTEKKAAWFTLHTCLEAILKMFAPIIPFITDYIFQELYSKKSLHLQEFPKAKWDAKLTKVSEKILEFNSHVWNEKKKKGLSLRDEIKIKIPKDLKKFEKDLRAMHKIKSFKS